MAYMTPGADALSKAMARRRTQTVLNKGVDQTTPQKGIAPGPAPQLGIGVRGLPQDIAANMQAMSQQNAAGIPTSQLSQAQNALAPNPAGYQAFLAAQQAQQSAGGSQLGNLAAQNAAPPGNPVPQVANGNPSLGNGISGTPGGPTQIQTAPLDTQPLTPGAAALVRARRVPFNPGLQRQV
jgi:hypothetical protein